jgi:hypothetical protein
MPSDQVKPALRRALRHHEIGDKSPYQLFFAKKGKSGASFGFMQGDLAAGQPEVQATFKGALAAAGIAGAMVESLTARLSVPLEDDPLAPEEAILVNGALLASKDLVDRMDEGILGDVYADLDKCIAAADSSGRSLEATALLYIAMWINMSGHPTKLLRWLRGEPVELHRRVEPPGPVIDEAAIRRYLEATDYFTRSPRNFRHMADSATHGAAAFA